MGPIPKKSLQRPNVIWRNEEESNPTLPRYPPKVLIASKEDLFLFKGITEREADLDDMRILAQSGLNWETISQECKSQSEISGVCWEDALYQNLIDLKARYSIASPIENPSGKLLNEKSLKQR